MPKVYHYEISKVHTLINWTFTLFTLLTLINLVPGIPRDIRFTQVTYEFVNVQWNAPIRPNGDIIGYEVQYKRNITGAQYTKHQEQIQPFARTARVKGLVFNSYYLFEIRGRTVSGWGPYATEVVLITTDRRKYYLLYFFYVFLNMNK